MYYDDDDDNANRISMAASSRELQLIFAVSIDDLSLSSFNT
jgi:hypothetical protein